MLRLGLQVMTGTTRISIMTKTLQQVVHRLAQLPAPVQERLAQRFMRELDAELQESAA